jgi:hypothetical protein
MGAYRSPFVGIEIVDEVIGAVGSVSAGRPLTLPTSFPDED